MRFVSGVAGAAALLACVPAHGQTAQAPVAAPVAPVAVTAVPAAQVTVAQPTVVTNGSLLPSNTEIFLALDSELTSKKAKVGDSISFRVARDVMLGQYVVIPRGTPATGKVTFRTGKGVFGKSAKMEFSIDRLELGGRSIALSAQHRIAGEGNTGATLGAVAATGLVGGLFVTGRSAIAAPGTEWKAMTKEPIAIQVASN